MAPSSLMLPILLIGLLALEPTIGSELLNDVCLSPSSNFTSPTQYNTNVDSLLKFLTSRSTLASTGFSMGSMGQPNTQKAYGLINCQPGTSTEDCRACGHDSVKAARSLCPGSQGAVLWYDNCILKYSDSNFLGSVDTDNQFTMSSPISVSGDPAPFNSKVSGMLTKLSKKAVTDPKLFAKGKMNVDSNTTVYATVGCTRDLSSKECDSCLGVVIGGLDVCCYGVKGGRHIAASCMFRYEIYPF